MTLGPLARGAARAVLTVLALVAPALTRAETPASDPKAIAIADQVMAALGGREKWDSLRGLRWTFVSASGDTLRPARRHAWDKVTGWQRVEGKNRMGQPYVMIENLSDSKGMAMMNGNAIEGDSLGKLMKRAQSLWINDSYWFLMPYKLRDPGVTLKYDGEVKDGDRTFDRITLSFERVGDTPGDRYWVYVNQASHRVERWDFILQGEQPPAETWTWEGWEQHDRLWFPTAHKRDNMTIFTREVETVTAFGPSEFKAP